MAPLPLSASPGSLSIDQARLASRLAALGRIGAYKDERSGLVGVNRLALTDADAEGRRHVVALMRELGLEVTLDRIGNVYGRRAGAGASETLAPVMMGSHIDSVPTAGIFDGCLGVLGALEIIQTLNDAGRRTKRPIVAAFFTDEEGARFGTDMLGSAVATGRLALGDVYALRDRDGKSVHEELSRIGFVGTASEKLTLPPYAYLETHIEQGPILRARGVDIGVVEGVQAISWHEVTIIGKSAHAGTTPMDLRSDAGVAAARINLKLREMIASGQYGPAMRATMGGLVPYPGLVNIVPGRVVATVDLRNPDDALMRASEEALLAYYEQVGREEKVQVSWRQTARTVHVPFASKVRERVAAAALARGLSSASIISGAGHDAQEVAHVCDAGMVFVPGEYDGISHNPREYSTPKQCADGVNVMLDVLLSLVDE
jgi:N-carbamoyl-L-amino-acid hydrolase